MKSILTEELMVPLDDCASLPPSASLAEAVLALERVFAHPHAVNLPARSLLVRSDGGEVEGLLGYVDVLRGLEPKYRGLLEHQGMAHLGFTRKFVQSMLAQYNLWEHPLDDICKKAANQHVRDFLYVPRADEFIRRDATLDEAVHQLVVGNLQLLLVTVREAAVGVLRLSDVFGAVSERIKACRTGG